MRLLFVADSLFRNFWESLTNSLIDEDSFCDWCSIHSQNLEKTINEGNYDFIIFMSYSSALFSENFLFFLSEKRVKFIVIAREEEEVLKRKMSISDLGCENLFYYLKLPYYDSNDLLRSIKDRLIAEI